MHSLASNLKNKGIIIPMNMKIELQKALTTAMKTKDEDTKRTLRLVMASIKLAEVETGGEIEDSKILNILQKEVKTREDSIEEAKKAGREDLISASNIEIAILNKFLPQQMSPDELKQLANEIITQTGANSIRDMGEVMKILIPKLEGRASGQEASKVVRNLLQNS
jgi:uncharacterized protein YqeY